MTGPSFVPAGSNEQCPPYAELHCLSNFTFLRGASHAEELIVQARELGYTALAITDECSLAGVVRAHTAVKKIGGGIQLIIGAELALEDGMRLVILARTRAGYGRLSRLITRGRRAAEKGSYRLSRDDVAELLCHGASPSAGDVATPRPPDDVAAGTLVLWLPSGGADDAVHGSWLRAHFAERAWIAVELVRDGCDRE